MASARNSARAQQASLLSDALTADRNAITADNSAIVSENNAKIAEWQARDAIASGENSVTDQMRARSDAMAASRTETATTKSRQKVALAANGVDITEGSAADVLTSTDYVGELNANKIADAADRNIETIRDNAIKNAWGYRVQSTNYYNQAANSRADAALYRDDASRLRSGSSAISPGTAGLVSLLGSAGQVASTWYANSKPTK